MPLVPPDQQDRRDEYAVKHALRKDLYPLIQRVVFFADVTADAIDEFVTLGPDWTAAVSADRGVWTPNKDDVQALRDGQGRVVSWCDCRPAGEGTPAQAAIDLANDPDLKLDGWIGQAETIDELQNSVGIDKDGCLVAPQGAERAELVIGNPNAWTQEQRAATAMMVAGGDLAISGEVYDGNPLTYSSQGVPIASMTLGVAMDKGVHYPLGQLLDQVRARDDHEKFLTTVCVWHATGLTTDEWALLRELG